MADSGTASQESDGNDTISAVRAVIWPSVVVSGSGDEGKASVVPRGMRSGAIAGADEGVSSGATCGTGAPSISAFISASLLLAPPRLEGWGLADSARVMIARRAAPSAAVIAWCSRVRCGKSPSVSHQ